MFKYQNKDQNLTQTFGVNMKYYKGHQRTLEVLDEFYDFPDNMEYKLDGENPDGSYVFFPEWRDPMPKSFGQLDENVQYQKGKLLEQYTVKFDRATPAGPQQGIIRVLHS
jgi:hypothetical protein